MGARDVLARFRPSGAPGAPAVAGVPVDRVAERSVELEPVFELLAGVQAEVEQIGTDAERVAIVRRAMAGEQARTTVAAARQAADAERARAAAAAQAGAGEQANSIVAEAQRAAAALAEQAGARRADLVDDVVRRARDEILSLVGATR